MRILFVSNFYPPHHLGGMELRCQEVVAGLRARGHECQVLTSNLALPGAAAPDDETVHRTLYLESDIYHYHPFEHLANYGLRVRANVRALKSLVARFSPDIVFIWGMWNLSPAVATAAERLCPRRVVYSFAGYWAIEPDSHEQFWRADGGSTFGAGLRRLAAPLALSRIYRPATPHSLQFEQAVTCSHFVLDRLHTGGLRFGRERIVFSGIDVEHFTPAKTRPPYARVRVLHAGGFATHKGAETAIQAVGSLIRDGRRNIELVLMGRSHPERRALLEQMVSVAGIDEWVRFAEAEPRQRMPEVYRQFDALVLPTLSPEPLSRVVMEGMACGLAVVATDTGGTPEMISDGRDGLLFAAGDSAALANHLDRLAHDDALRGALSAAARRTAETRFRIERMNCEIEAFLSEAL